MAKQFIGSCVSNPFGSAEKLSKVLAKGVKYNKVKFIGECDIDMEVISDMRAYTRDYKFFRSGSIRYYELSGIEYFFQ